MSAATRGLRHTLTRTFKQLPGVRELISIPGLGPKKAMAVYQELGISSVDGLVEAIDDDRVAALKGFGKRTQDNILRGIEQLSSAGGRVQVSVALDVAETILAELTSMRRVKRAAYAGSLRRMRETVGDVDLLKLNEYGLFDAKSGELLAAETEGAVYERLGLPFVPPTLREDRGEIEAALGGELPAIVELKQLRGDLHTHTNLTDGLAPLEEMVEHAAERGYAYYAVTDHAPNLFMQRMTDDKVLAQRGELAALQRRFPKMHLLHGSELNIDPEGNVDWEEDFLAGFDVTVASVHSHFTLQRHEQTRRVIRAIENPRVNVIGHLTGRRIGSRSPIDLDLDAVFEAAARTGTALEINSHPDRLDLKDEHVLWARRHGVRFAVDTDAHAPVHLPLMRFGLATAQRGWLTKDDVINAWPLGKLRRFLRKGRKD